MWGWVVQNKEWVFSGAGLTALGVLWWLITKFWPKREIAAPAITQAPSTSIAPSIVMNPTINIDSRAPEPAKPVTPSVPTLVAPKAKPNLCNEAVKIQRFGSKVTFGRCDQTLLEARVDPIGRCSRTFPTFLPMRRTLREQQSGLQSGLVTAVCRSPTRHFRGWRSLPTRCIWILEQGKPWCSPWARTNRWGHGVSC